MIWHRSWKADPRGRPLADRHYPRQKKGSLQFAPPGRTLVLITAGADALWITSWPKYAQHEWVGAWINSVFRNESSTLSSSMILDAVAATRAFFGDPPPLGMVTFVAPEHLKPGNTNPGYCYLKAGFKKVGWTKKRRRRVLQLLPADMPLPEDCLARLGTYA